MPMVCLSLMDLDRLLQHSLAVGASDVHLKHGQPPLLRQDGTIMQLDGWPPLGTADLEDTLRQVTASSPARLAAFQEEGDVDIAYTSASQTRFRLNAFRQRGDISFAFRVIPNKV